MRFLDVSGIRSSFDIGVPAGDGVRLSVDLYMPSVAGSYPVIITRTPYDNNRVATVAGTPLPSQSPAARYKRLAAEGFVVVASDVRGRGDSDGEFVPFVHEADDGASIVEWARQLPECNGKIGVIGSGYAAYAATAAAARCPVDAVVSVSTFGGAELPFDGGLLRPEWLLWMHLAGGRTPQPVDVVDWHQVFRSHPLISMPEVLGRDEIPWMDWLCDPPAPPASDYLEIARTMTGPCLFVTGWWDNASEATMRQWEVASECQPGLGHRLVVGPWDPAATRRPRAEVGGIDWGPGSLLDPDELTIEWLRTCFDLGTIREDAGAKIFVTGRNAWERLDTPSPDCRPRKLFLASGGGANTRQGDGSLSSDAGSAGSPDIFRHVPQDPVPWQPSYGSFLRSDATRFTLDSAFATARDDVLVYTSEKMDADTVVMGRPEACIWMESSAESADCIVVIEDVFPGGQQSVNLAHGAIRFEGECGPTELRIPMTPVAHEILRGHRLRLLVSSSLFPLYAINPGGRDYLRCSEAIDSEHRLHHEKRYPSFVVLPVIPVDRPK